MSGDKSEFGRRRDIFVLCRRPHIMTRDEMLEAHLICLPYVQGTRCDLTLKINNHPHHGSTNTSTMNFKN